MGWIKERILAEKRKHGSMPQGLEKYNLDWARLAESKIKAQIKEMIRECPDKDYVGEFLMKKFDSENLKTTKDIKDED